VEKKIIDGKKYFIDKKGSIYDETTKFVGLWYKNQHFLFDTPKKILPTIGTLEKQHTQYLASRVQ
jgi:hypothetical protein